ncbi:MAG: hypothetical protein Q8L27_02810, partial [archaeon]|nr:hypothetical protein [archaeon]
MKEKGMLALVFAFVFILCLSAVSSAITKGTNNTVADKYGPGEGLKGEINILFTNLDFDSKVTAFTSSINLIDLLENAGVDYTCSNADCGMDYVLTSENAKSFTLNSGKDKLIGLKIFSSNLASIDEFILNINSSAGESCSSPLIVDVLDGQGIEWSSSEIGNSYCGTENYGCYNPSQGNLMAGSMGEGKLYCQNFNFSAGKSFKLGADVSGTGPAKFKFSILDTFCEVEVSVSGKASCDVELDLLASENLPVCVEQDLDFSNNGYKLFTESSNSCGFIEGTSTEADFSMFSQQKKYAPLGNFLVSSGDI